MQIFFIIDEVNNLEDKINLLKSELTENIKFLVNSKTYLQISNDKFIIDNLIGLYENNPVAKLDEFVKSDRFVKTDVLVYYSSVKVDEKIISQLREKMKFKYDAIYFRRKANFFERCFRKIYSFIIKYIAKNKDAFCSTKIQYLSEEFVEYLRQNNFCDYIFLAENSVIIDVEDEDIKNSLKEKLVLEKNFYYSLIVFAVVVVCGVLVLKFFDMPFWLNFSVILLVILSVVMPIIILLNSVYKQRYKLKK